MTDGGGSANLPRKESEIYEGKLYFPVENITLTDLDDFCSKHGENNTKTKERQTYSALTVVNDSQIALFHYKTKVYAISDKCPHTGGPLHLGDIEVLPDKSVCVRCPWHSWKFDLDTGECRFPPGRKDKKAVTYPVKINLETGQLGLDFVVLVQRVLE